MQIDSAKDPEAAAGRRMVFMVENEITFIVSGGTYLTLKGSRRRLADRVRSPSTDSKPVEGMKVNVERAGNAPLSSKTNGAGEAEKIVADYLQQLKATFYKPAK